MASLVSLSTSTPSRSSSCCPVVVVVVVPLVVSVRGGFSEALNGTVDSLIDVTKHWDTVTISQVGQVQPSPVVVCHRILR